MKNVTLLDGAFGTSIWEKTGETEPVWVYNIRRPDVVQELTREYVEAGAQIVQINTFGANGPAVKRSSDYTVKEVVQAAVKIAKEAVRGTDVKISLSAGPLTQMMEPFGDLTEEDVAEIYDEMFSAAMELDEKPDIIALETFLDLNMLEVAADTAKKYDVPVFCTMSFEAVGKTMFGNSVEDVVEVLEDVGVDAVGLNCGLGPDLALPIAKQFAEKTDLPIIFKPNAGKPVLSPDGKTTSPYTAQMFADEVAEAAEYAAYMGGCCGSAPSYITALKEKLGL